VEGVFEADLFCPFSSSPVYHSVVMHALFCSLLILYSFKKVPTQPPIQWVPGTLSLGVKWPGREADHSPPSSAEVKE
jgi:hypothetical protein